MARKSVEKSGPSRLPDGRVAPGRGPKRGAKNAGRPKGTYLDWLGELLDSDDHRAEFEAQVKGRRSEKAFSFATKHAAAYKHGLPTQSVELTGKDGAPFTVRLVRE